jgi:hypothetical protein
MNAEKGKSRWGIGVLTAYLVFIVGIMTLVFISMSQQIDLVSEKYYDQGIHYQERIDAIKNSSSLKEQLTIESGADNLVLHFPRQFSPHEIGGSITLYRPDNKSGDARIDVALDTAFTQIIPSTHFQRGLWRVKVDWSAAGTSYYFEQPVIIQ